MTLLLSTALALAQGEYGVPSTDPYTDGYPSSAERELHLWTNAVRVDPEAFKDVYPCAFTRFTATEQSPHAPLYLDMGLAEAGRYHSLDMQATGNFSHSSSDGTDFGTRVGRFYDDGMVGENIAWNYPDPYSTVMTGWMCSSGHRANIMSDYTELGVGIAGAYYTQDFGGGAIDSTGPVAMGAHSPQGASSQASFLADWLDPTSPVRLDVVLDRTVHPLSLRYGTETQGVYGVDLSLDPVDCHLYHFAWATADGRQGSFPEKGSYTFGSGCTDGIGWVPEQLDPDGILGGLPGSGADQDGIGGGGDGRPLLGDPRLIGCAATPGGGAGIAGLLLALAATGRRRGRGAR